MRKFIASILSFSLFSVMTGVILFTAFQTILTKDTIDDYLTKVDVLELDIGSISNSESKTLKEVLIESMSGNEVLNDATTDVVESDEFKTAVNDFFGDALGYIVLNEDKPIFDVTEIKEIVLAEEKVKQYTSVFGTSAVEAVIDDFGVQVTNIVPNRNEISNIDKVDAALSLLNTVKPYLYLSLIGLALLIILVLWSIKSGFITVGVISLVTGAMFTGISLLKEQIYSLVSDKIENANNIVKPLFDIFMEILQKTSLIYLIVGAVLIILGVIISIFYKSSVEN